ncbi:undecaprenyl-phosphate galactose phosphotransferase WbaP [Serratia ureilytica]|uniref:undecaprenyl-phosphate galactose phosphotransferase WbaP n=1 Tax=Serratia TaxID=613 RepID=UPI00062C4401|nr:MULTISPECIES: undecaprenyl-phosphate galactose phosphotransferase WbaP [Serratia]KKZ19479.1 UDP-phosphate galactose phosphotransferase [Serratia marcescens]MDI3198794.1 undecaprenyl-phosphate galactose phosphotransferase WbaP [Serratia ureilytica]
MNSESIKSKPVFVKFTLAFSDLFFFNFSLFLSVAVISFISNDIYEYIPKSVMGTFFFSHFVLSLACTFWFLVRLRHYSYRKPFWFELKEMLRTIIIFAIISLAFVGFSKWELSRYVWLLTWLFALILIPAFRIITKHVFNVLGLWKKQTIIIGSGRNAEEAYVALQSEEILGFDVVAFYCLSPEDERESLFGKKLIKSEEELWDLVDPENTQVIVAVEFEQHALRDYWLKTLAKHACRSVSVIPTLRGVPLYGTDMSFIFSHEVMILRVNNNLAKLTSRFVKRVFDIFGSLAIMTILSPVLLGILLMVSKDGGKPIYGHERVGLKGRKFKCLKFRSMVTNSKEVLANLLATDSEALAEWNKDFKLKNDPRITKIGGFIRKTSLDELPQLWNVLRGDMSLVGPRPIIEEELERYAGDVDYYLMAKPGMTGLWQVSGRNDVDYDTRVYFDSWYVKNWSLWNDIVILFKTVNVVLRRDGAY